MRQVSRRRLFSSARKGTIGGPEATAQPAEQLVVPQSSSQAARPAVSYHPLPLCNQPQQYFYNIPWLLLFVF